MKDFFMDTYNRTGIIFSRGSGAVLQDVQGKLYLDLSSGIGVNCLGHNNPGLRKALGRQIRRLIHVSNYYQTNEALQLAARLCAIAKMDKVFLCNSGAEANEAAIKIARKFGSLAHPRKTTIVSLQGSFHGRTITTLSATGQSKFHSGFMPLTPGFIFAEPGNFAMLDKLLDESVCAFLVEPIQGESGVVPVDKNYLVKAAEVCKARNILFISDEIQCGIGRTGSFFAISRLGIEPDLATIAKGLGGGVPIGATLAKGVVSDTFKKGDHGSTFGGNPLAAAGANYVLSVLEAPGFLASIEAKGTHIMDQIASWKHPLVQAIRGRGLIIGLRLACSPLRVRQLCIEQGLLVLGAGEDTLRLLPPYIISYKQIALALKTLRVVLDIANKEVHGKA